MGYDHLAIFHACLWIIWMIYDLFVWVILCWNFPSNPAINQPPEPSAVPNSSSLSNIVIFILKFVLTIMTIGPAILYFPGMEKQFFDNLKKIFVPIN